MPAPPPVGGAEDAVVVLLVEQVLARRARRADHVVHAVADLGGVVPVAVVPVAMVRMPGVVAPVAAVPGGAAVLGGEDAGGRDPQPQAGGVGRGRHDGVQGQARAPRLPAVARGVVGEALHLRPGLPPVAAGEERGGLGAGVERAVGPQRQRPQRLDLAGEGGGRAGIAADVGAHLRVGGQHLVELAVGEQAQRPALAAVGRAPDAGAGPLAPAAGPQAPRGRIADRVVDRPAVAERAAHGPVAAGRVALEQEHALGGSRQHRDHRRTAPLGLPLRRGRC